MHDSKVINKLVNWTLRKECIRRQDEGLIILYKKLAQYIFLSFIFFVFLNIGIVDGQERGDRVIMDNNYHQNVTSEPEVIKKDADSNSAIQYKKGILSIFWDFITSPKFLAILAVVGLIVGVISIKPVFFDKTTEQVVAPIWEDMKRNHAELLRELSRRGYQEEFQSKILQERDRKIQELESALEIEKSGNQKSKEQAIVALRKGDSTKAIALFEAIAAEERKKVQNYAQTMFNLGTAYFVALRFDDALKSYHVAVSLEDENGLYLNELGYLYYTLGKYSDAILYITKALDSNKKTLGEKHPYVITNQNNLGSAYWAMGNYVKSLEFHQMALRGCLEINGPEHPETATLWNNIGTVYSALGQPAEAIEFYNKALKNSIKYYAADHPQLAIYFNNIAGAYQSMGQYDKAMEYCNKTLKSDMNNFGNNHPRVARDLNNLGSVYDNMGQYAQAVEFYKKALAILKSNFGENHPHISITMENLAKAEARLK